MSKVTWKSGTFEYPIPAVMVSCGDMENSNMKGHWISVFTAKNDEKNVGRRIPYERYDWILRAGL